MGSTLNGPAKQQTRKVKTMSENKVEMDFVEFLNSTVESLVLPIFNKDWITLEEDERNAAILKFVTLHKFVGTMRQSFDDALTTEHAKGNLSDVTHIRKPRDSKEAKAVTMTDFLKNLTK